jgi:carboxypeptidase T
MARSLEKALDMRRGIFFAAAGLAMFACAPAAHAAGLYEVRGVRDVVDRSAIAARGPAIVEVDHDAVIVTATKREMRRVARLGYQVSKVRPPKATRRPRARASDFPAADSAYHNYAETVNELTNVANAYPSLVQRINLGNSYQGRAIYALKVSDNVTTDEAEPEVMFTANQHAREHLTVEMALYLLGELTSKYASDARIKAIVDSRRRVRHRLRFLPLVAQEPPAELGLHLCGHGPQPQLGLPLGVLRRLVGLVLE